MTYAASLVAVAAGLVRLAGGDLAGLLANGVGSNKALLGLNLPGAVHATLVVHTVEDNVGANILNAVGGGSSL